MRALVVVVVVAFAALLLALFSIGGPPSVPSSSSEPQELRFKILEPGSAAVLRAFGARPLFDVDDAPLAAGGPDLSVWWSIETADVETSMRDLVNLGASDVSLRPELVPAVLDFSADEADVVDGESCPIKTPSYDARQGYLGAIHVEAAWRLPGGRGQGVQLADVEGDWNAKHEDTAPQTHVAGRKMGRSWSPHGTAVLGVVAAKDNGVGMTGIAPEIARIFTASLGNIGAARALHEAAKALSPGDVLIVELHGPGPNSKGRGQQGYVAMEWWQPEYEAIKWATTKGVVVVEAAGNGSEDLDAKVYRDRFNREFRDSGAILVGAGAPDGDGVPARSRLGFSNFGSRLDVQGWGGSVATLDYGDLQGCSDASRKYTARFSGTSSASPVVAGAAVVVQGAYAAKKGARLSPIELRSVLTVTGQQQTSSSTAPSKQHIGPLPDVARALSVLAIE
ncbi:MAG: S8 family serine peptidase [Deltaproteobacteria bacterium]|nr:S8 family serine peptidase [Deltaproteobacteria bacterium]